MKGTTDKRTGSFSSRPALNFHENCHIVEEPEFTDGHETYSRSTQDTEKL